MRIIAGQFKSRLILPPEDEKTTRPITDRVKQSLFDILNPWIPDATVYDCFAGTGSMGLECLSRGAQKSLFFEADRSALARLKKNIASLSVVDQSQVIPGDLFKYFESAPPPHSVSLIFLDPPYRYLNEQSQSLQRLATRLASHLAPDGLLIFRHDAKESLPLPSLQLANTRNYGGMTVEFLKPLPATSPTTFHTTEDQLR